MKLRNDAAELTILEAMLRNSWERVIAYWNGRIRVVEQ
jgi:hypothetical protein